MADNGSAKASSLAKFGAVTSVISIVLTLGSFVYTHLRPANIRIMVGNGMYISYGHEGNMGIVIPIVYSNTGAVPGVVNSVKLRCGKKDSQRSDTLYPIYYFNVVGNNMEAFVIPEILKGGEQFARTVIFWSEVDWIKTHDFSVGDYGCGVLASYDDGGSTEVARFSFYVRQDDIDHIKTHPPAKTNRFIFTDGSGGAGVVIRNP